jgi:hypothetical protein
MWRVVSFFLIAVVFLATPGIGLAQDGQYSLNLNRNFGFSSGSQIRGTFTVDVIGPEGIQSVTYLIDGQKMAEVSQAPFGYKFNTSSYPVGWHELSASVTTADGRTGTTPARRFQFVSAEEESAVTQRILLPMLGGVLVLLIVSMGASMLGLRSRSRSNLPLGAARHYGLSGGTVCPRCKRPFPLHWWAPHLLTSKFDRCEFCGRVGWFKPAGRDELAAAEQAELASAQPEQPVVEKSEEEKLRELIDESRYTK